MSINKEFAPYQESFELKELGFDEPCFAIYVDKQLQINATYQNHLAFKGWVASPTLSQAFRFFRKKHGLYHIIHCPSKDVAIFTITGFDIPSVHSDVDLKSYEEAELACLRKLIQIVKEKTRISTN